MCIQIIIIIINIIVVLLAAQTGQAGRFTDDPEGFKGWVGQPEKGFSVFCFHFCSPFLINVLYLKLEFAN